MKQISFIIPHKGREALLLQTVKSVIEQDYDLHKVELIIVTQNDSLSPEFDAFREYVDLSIYSRPDTDTISALRNFGVQHSSAEYLAFLDADVALSRNWISGMLHTLNSSPDRVISSAVQKNSTQAPPLERIRTALSNAVVDQDVNFLPGRNLFLSRQTFDQLGGFPDHLVTCEDYYFTDRASRLGKLFYTTEAEYVHLGEDKVYSEMFHKEIWRGQSNLQSIKGRPIPLSEIPSFIVPIGICILLIVAAVLAITGHALLAGVSFIFALLPVAAYSIRLYRLCRDQVSFADVLSFYLYYFPARAIGTLAGIFRTLNTGSHSR